MKKLLIPALAVVFLAGCNESIEKTIGLSKPQLRTVEPAPQEPLTEPEQIELTAEIPIEVENEAPRVEFPIEKTITDAKGRSIQAKVLAKKGNQIAIERIPSNQRFVLTLETLSRADREVFASISDGGDFSSATSLVSAEENASHSSDRRAVWHSHITNAENEAKRLGIPLLVAVANGMDKEVRDNLEKSLVYSGEFKKWADRNVALCFIEVESGSRESTFETWKILAKYGIAQSKENVVALINPLKFTSEVVPPSEAISASRIIVSLDEAIRGKSSWASICAAPAPRRQASPFRVNSGAT